MEALISFADSVFGVTADEISTHHILSRSVVIYIIGIALVRLGNKRFVGKMTAFDFIIAIIIGSLLSRAITEIELFLKVIPGCLLLILMHRLFSFLSAKHEHFGSLIKGKERIVVENGEILKDELYKSNLSEHDLIQSLRLNAQITDIGKVKIARLERNGDISFILKEGEE